ncbi:MAG: peptidylprolyl isomerase [Eubacteriales bacterium]|nr:peptidylprolyl isomerase [Eubacteriales bacterium]
MKRKFLMMFCAAALTAGLLAGCGGTDTKEKTETTDNAQDTEDKGQTGTQAGEDDGEVADEEEAEAAGFTDGAEEEADSAEDGTGEADGDSTKDGTDAEEDDSQTAVLDTTKPLSGTHHAEIIIKDYGTIDVELDADTAPITVTNFVKLAQENFYDGLTFHRIIDGFMIQGGDPQGDGKGGSEENIKGEFSNNGVDNDISHARGVISMARATDYDSASSQFFIVQADSTYLDGDYAAFGHVTEGLDIIDQICKDAKPTDQNGSISADQQPVIEKVKIID